MGAPRTATVTIPAPIEGAELSLYAATGSLSGSVPARVEIPFTLPLPPGS